jgi:hypothetical protein
MKRGYPIRFQTFLRYGIITTLLSLVLAACRRKTSEVFNDLFVGTVTWIIQPIWRQNHLLKLPKSGKIALSDRLLGNPIRQH